MILDQICPECKEKKIFGPHRVQGVSIDLPGWSTAALTSFTCAGCGYTSLFADHIGLKNLNRAGRELDLDSDPKTHCDNCEESLRPQDRYCPTCGTLALD